jgi:hypothetical protein
MKKQSTFTTLAIIFGTLLPVIFLALSSHIGSSNFNTPKVRMLIENVMLIMWPSSIINAPFQSVHIGVFILSVAINALAYAGLGISIYYFSLNKTFISLTFPILFLATGVFLVWM